MRAASQFSADTVRETLRITRLWATASDDVLQMAAERVEIREFAPGDVLIHQGERCEATHVVIEGRVEVRVLGRDGTETTICTLGEGESIGEMSLLTGEPASANVVAVESASTLAIRAEDYAEVVESDPALLRQVVRILSRRLSQTDVAVGAAGVKEQDLARLLQEPDDTVGVLVGSSAAIRKLQKELATLAKGRAPVLVRGEHGTRRAATARLLHRQSDRRAGPVIGVSCTDVVDTPFGDQVFSAPGARATSGSALSYLELAQGGTLILKDLDRLPPGAQQRLLHHLRAEQPPFDVRIVATAPEGTGGDHGRIDEDLLACFGERVLVVPPVRERKRDIPLLAQQVLKKHAGRLGKQAHTLSDAALTKLVSYDYHIANDRELEAAIERAVILTDGDCIEAETLFLGPPPPPRGATLNLLALPGVNAQRLARWLVPALRVATALFVTFIFVQAFFGPSAAEGNLATTLVWALWWPALVLSFFLAGRLWCGICPMGWATSVGDRLRPKKLRLPAWLKEHDTQVAMGGLLLIVLVEETTGMRHSPVATGLLLLAILAGAAITGLLFPRRTWCRHVCPLGGLAGVCATSGLLELRPTYDICAAKCKGHACYKGDENTAGCPMFNHVMFVDTNQHCVLCMNCVQSCPNGSPQLNLRLPSREIWGGTAAGPGLGLFVLMLMGLLVGLAGIQHLERVGHGLVQGAGRPWVVGAIVLASALLPLLLSRPFRLRAERGGPEAGATLWRRVVAWTPVVTAGLVAYQLEYLPGLSSLHASLYTTQGSAGDPWLSLSLLGAFRVVTLLGGGLVTTLLLWRAPPAEGSRVEGEEPAPRRWPASSYLAAGAYVSLLLALMLGT